MRRQKEIEKEKKVEMTAQKNEKIEGKSGSAERNKRTLIDGGIDKDFKDRSSRLKSSKNPGTTLKYGNMGRANLLKDNVA